MKYLRRGLRRRRVWAEGWKTKIAWNELWQKGGNEELSLPKVPFRASLPHLSWLLVLNFFISSSTLPIPLWLLARLKLLMCNYCYFVRMVYFINVKDLKSWGSVVKAREKRREDLRNVEMEVSKQRWKKERNEEWEKSWGRFSRKGEYVKGLRREGEGNFWSGERFEIRRKQEYEIRNKRKRRRRNKSCAPPFPPFPHLKTPRFASSFVFPLSPFPTP